MHHNTVEHYHTLQNAATHYKKSFFVPGPNILIDSCITVALLQSYFAAVPSYLEAIRTGRTYWILFWLAKQINKQVTFVFLWAVLVRCECIVSFCVWQIDGIAHCCRTNTILRCGRTISFWSHQDRPHVLNPSLAAKTNQKQHHNHCFLTGFGSARMFCILLSMTN